ncbi:bifunctional Trafficking protein particle complex subunit/Longin-like domain superfamily [Babesia duncani]|uniref:Trafficking protein particle complex subunit n=1 Tax=Babesia duncani TaxID=323732 RepID=A0AAD9PJE8_9APIC|nr:bifunctional Trafficking protein particle complex subunit/Longin-like domain superfamily [Babesia duncani]
MAVIHGFHIFLRKKCIYQHLYSDAALRAVKRCLPIANLKENSTKISNNITEDNSSDDLKERCDQYEKLLVGFLSGLAAFSKTITVTNELKGPTGLSVAYFNACATTNFKIHYLETITGYKLVCITSPDVSNLDVTLEAIYKELITNTILTNPLYIVGDVIKSPEIDDIIEKTLKANI